MLMGITTRQKAATKTSESISPLAANIIHSSAQIQRHAQCSNMPLSQRNERSFAALGIAILARSASSRTPDSTAKIASAAFR